MVESMADRMDSLFRDLHRLLHTGRLSRGELGFMRTYLQTALSLVTRVIEAIDEQDIESDESGELGKEQIDG